MNKNIKNIIKFVLLGGALWMLHAFAFADATDGIAVSTLAGNVDKTVGGLATVLSDISLVAGVGFVLASFFKFHQHKLNPTQVPISQGVTLLLIGAALVLFPTMLTTSKRAVFGSTAEVSKIGGEQIHDIIGGSTSSASGG